MLSLQTLNDAVQMFFSLLTFLNAAFVLSRQGFTKTLYSLVILTKQEHLAEMSGLKFSFLHLSYFVLNVVAYSPQREMLGFGKTM